MQNALAVMAVCVVGGAVLSAIAIVVDEWKHRRRIEANVDQADTEQTWQEAARRALFRG